MYKKISDYGIVGDLRTVALIGLDGSVDWMCLPHIDSPSVFAALLDHEKGGRFGISPQGEWTSSAEYLPGTNVLNTTFKTPEGTLQLTDFMPVREDSGSQESPSMLYRCFQARGGEVRVIVSIEPKLDYARLEPSLYSADGSIVVEGGGEKLHLSSTHELLMSGCVCRSEITLKDGEKAWLRLCYGRENPGALEAEKAEQSLKETTGYWRGWINRIETGRTLDLGRYKDMVDRSALLLKLLFYGPTGTIAAAATTSLPEEIGGVRNWDYRYTWVRDTSFTLQALFNLGHLSETQGYLRWIENLLSEHGAGKMQIMYGLRGEEDLSEIELEHLEGYRGSRPVRVGNAAAKQRQLDIYGELMNSAMKLSDYVGKVDSRLWPFLRGICDYAAEHWDDRDSGIWEVRGGPWDFVYSKLMCWVALDRGLTIARRYGFPTDFQRWERARQEIREEILEKGWNEEKGAFVQHFDTEAADASNLLISILGFLPHDDPRVASNLDATLKELGHEGFLYRYRAEDGLEGEEGVFLLCSFWLIDNFIALGRLEEAEKLIGHLEGVANHLGLFSEEYDTKRGELLGNFPQAFTHIGYINSVTALCRARREQEAEEEVVEHRRLPFFGSLLLNDGEPAGDIATTDLAGRLKNSINILRGAFFDTRRGRVAYEKMRLSDAYREYRELSYSLKQMDLGGLASRQERLAFWINLYNVIVIHGVIELGIEDSIKEARGFLKRIRYQIGYMFFSPDDIEHGILRANRRPPYIPIRRFGAGDSRAEHIVEPLDPRIHFALVCASSSCPPIEVYRAENIDEELDIAGRTFINAGGLVLDREAMRVSLSYVFKWYGRDFGSTDAELLKNLSRFLYNDEDGYFVEENADRLHIDFQAYDWRLNRY